MTGMEVVMTSYFAEPEFAGLFSSSRRETAAATASQIIELAGISPGERVIDLCCGPGLVSQLLAERVGPSGEVIGVDASAAMIELARQNVIARNCRFVEGDAYALPSLVPTPVDCVVATSAWQNFLLDKERIVPAVRAVLRPWGRFTFDVRLREAGGDDAADGPTLARLRERVIALLRQEHPGLALDQEAATVPLGAGRRYGREEIDRDVALLEASGFRLAMRKEVEGGPFAAAWCERQRWRADYWLARVAPGLTAETRASVLDRVAAEARASLSSMPQQVMTAYVVMEAVPPR
jgi:SAM-dependent methyltransferase